MAFLAKLLAQVLLLVLPKLVNDLVDYFKKNAEVKKLEEDNKKKGEVYAEAPVDHADADFSKLP